MYIEKDTGEARSSWSDKRAPLRSHVIFLCCLLFFHIYNIFVDLPFHFSTILRYAQKRAVCSSSSGIDFRTSVDVSHSQLSNDTMHIRVIWAIAVWPKQQTRISLVSLNADRSLDWRTVKCLVMLTNRIAPTVIMYTHDISIRLCAQLFNNY